jgi:hypothetical protein
MRMERSGWKGSWPYIAMQSISLAMLFASSPACASLDMEQPSGAFFGASGQTSTDTFSWQHTVSTGGTDRLLIVEVFAIPVDINVSPANVTSVKFGQQTMKLAARSPNGVVYLYQLVAPKAGTQTITIKLSGLAIKISGLSMSFAGADQSQTVAYLYPEACSGVQSGNTCSVSVPSKPGDVVLPFILFTAESGSEIRPAVNWLDGPAQGNFGFRHSALGADVTTLSAQRSVSSSAGGPPMTIYIWAAVVKPTSYANWSIAGRVTHPDGSAVSNVGVRLDCAECLDQGLDAQTDSTGAYSFASVPASGTLSQYWVKPQPSSQYKYTPIEVSLAGLTANQVANFVAETQSTNAQPEGQANPPSSKPPIPTLIPAVRWTTQPNPKVAGMLGRLVVNFLKEVDYSFSRVEIFPAGGTAATKMGYGTSEVALPPSQYDVAVSGARVAQVPVTQGTDTSLLVGALRIQAGVKTRVEVWDTGHTKLLQWALGNAVVGLPIGPYAIKIGKGAGTFADVMIEDAKITDFHAP